MKKILLFLLFLPALLSAQQLSNQATISLLTCAPGSELYSAFGHSAIRIKDPLNRIDLAYGYGTFDFQDPNFYPKFIQRDLNYFLDVDEFKLFNRTYQYFKRSFDEQVLDLDSVQKQKVFDFIQRNMLPENRFYLYDFFFDNCATRIRDVLFNELEGELILPQKDTPSELTFRNILDQYLLKRPWADFGIDLALGAVIDRKATPWEQTFHPDYLARIFDTAENRGKPLVKQRRTLFESESPVSEPIWLISPLSLGLMALLVVLFFSWKNRDVQTQAFRWDAVFFTLMGLSGLLLLFLWFGTDHSATKNNWNLLWLLPTHLIAGILLFRKSRPDWLSRYFMITGGLTLLLLLGWFVIPQSFHVAFAPLMLISAVRSGILYKKMGAASQAVQSV